MRCVRRLVAVAVPLSTTLLLSPAASAATHRAASPATHRTAPAAAHRTPAQNQQAALRDATRLLARMVLPAGSTTSPTEPAGDGGELAQAPIRPALQDLVDEDGFWTLREPWQRVLDFLDSRSPAGGVLEEIGGGGGGVTGANGWSSYGFAPVPHVLVQRTLVFLVTPLAGGGTGIRADAEVQWLVPRG